MTGVRRFRPVNRLSKAIGDPHGMLVAHALQRAKANVEQVRPAHVAALDRKLEALRDLAPGVFETAPRHAAFYRLAQDVCTDAGAAGFAHISRAALSLCDLLVSGAGESRLKRGVAVHIEALAALRCVRDDGDDAQREAILVGLAAVAGTPR